MRRARLRVWLDAPGEGFVAGHGIAVDRVGCAHEMENKKSRRNEGLHVGVRTVVVLPGEM